MGSHSDPTYSPSRKRILLTFDSREAAMEHEVYLHRVRDVASNPRYANRIRATTSAFTFPITPEHIEAMRERNRGPNNPMYGRCGELSPQYGLKRTAESREKMRQSHLGKPSSRLGSRLDDAVRKKMSEEYRRKRWFHDPDSDKASFCFPEQIPPGFVPGRGRLTKNPPELRRVWFYDPVSKREARYVRGREPDGYILGKFQGKTDLTINAPSSEE